MTVEAVYPDRELAAPGAWPPRVRPQRQAQDRLWPRHSHRGPRRGPGRARSL